MNLYQAKKGGAFSGLDSVSVHDAKLELLSQPNATAKDIADYPQYNTFANPFSKFYLSNGYCFIQRTRFHNIMSFIYITLILKLLFIFPKSDVQSFPTTNVQNPMATRQHAPASKEIMR